MIRKFTDRIGNVITATRMHNGTYMCETTDENGFVVYSGVSLTADDVDSNLGLYWKEHPSDTSFMTDNAFINAIYEIAFGDSADERDFTHEEVVAKVREYSDTAYIHDEVVK